MSKNYKPGWRTAESRGRKPKKPSFIIFQLKTILPFSILVTLALIFVWPRLESMFEKNSSLPTMEQILKTNPNLENKVIHPKFESIDQKGQPFIVEAEYALHVTPEKTDLVNPSGQIKLKDGSTLSFTAKKGFYYKETETLELEDDVNVKTDKGYDVKTRFMTLLPKESRGEGHEPTFGTGPSGEKITSEGFKITDKGDKIDFLGKTQISLPGA